jgi:integrase
MTTRRTRYRTLNGLFKQCGCERKRWSECRHPWHMGLMHVGTPYRFSLNKRAGKPRSYVMSKTEADGLYERYRDQIFDGTFDANRATGSSDTRLSFGDVADRYIKEYVPFLKGERGKPRREGGRKLMEWMVKALKRVEIPARNGHTVTLADKPMADITTADIEAVRIHWPLKTKQPKGGTTGPDRNLKRLRHLFNWAIRVGIVESSPFRKAHLNVITFEKEDGRTRRLEGDEEQRLRTAAQADAAERSRQAPWLDDIIVAALQTGCRQGELLTLQWSQVKWPDGKKRGELFLPADKTKTKQDRWVPMTKPMLAVLEMRKHAPDGTEHGPDAYVFGNAVGEPRKQFPKTQWGRVCTAAKIEGLHFHDLRREFASRLLESGVVPLHEISAWLGHADIQTTSIYLRITSASLMQAVERLERVSATKPKKAKPRRPPTPRPHGGASVTVN